MLNKTKTYNPQRKNEGIKISKRRSESKKRKSKRKSKFKKRKIQIISISNKRSRKKRSRKKRRNYLDGVFDDDKFNEELIKIKTYVTENAGNKDAMIELADFLSRDNDFTLEHKIKIFDEMNKIIKIPGFNIFLNQIKNSTMSNSIVKPSTGLLDKNKINEKLKYIIIYVKNNADNYDALIKLTDSITKDDDFTLAQKQIIFNEMKKIIKIPKFDTFLNDLTESISKFSIGAPTIPVTRTSAPPVPIPVTRMSAPPIPITRMSAPPIPIPVTRMSAPPHIPMTRMNDPTPERQSMYEDYIRNFLRDKDLENLKIYVNKALLPVENNFYAEICAKNIFITICHNIDYNDDQINDLRNMLNMLIKSGKIGEKKIQVIIAEAILTAQNSTKRLEEVPSDKKIKIKNRINYVMQIILRDELSKYLNDDIIKKYTDLEDQYESVYGERLNVSLKSLSGVQMHSKM